MSYAEFGEVLFSFFTSALFGATASFFYVFVQTFIYTVERFVYLPKRVLVCSESFASLKNVKLTDVSVSLKCAKVKLFVSDFIYFVCYGIGLIFLLYLVCDGVFRLYPLITATSVSFILIKIFGKKLDSIIERILSVMYCCITALLAALALFLRIIFGGVFKVFSRLFSLLGRFCGKNTENM